jgi:hypothetical protein
MANTPDIRVNGNLLIEYAVDNLGSFVSLVSLVITVIMVGLAIRRASQAKESAKASEVASIEARGAITWSLTIVDLERAKALPQRLKDLHRASKWEATVEHYEELRQMLFNTDSTRAAATSGMLITFQEAIP